MTNSLITIRKVLTSLPVLLFLFLAPVSSFTDSKTPVRTEQVVNQDAGSVSRNNLISDTRKKSSQSFERPSFEYVLVHHEAYWKQCLARHNSTHRSLIQLVGFHSKIPSSADDLISPAAI